MNGASESHTLTHLKVADKTIWLYCLFYSLFCEKKIAQFRLIRANKWRTQYSL